MQMMHTHRHSDHLPPTLNSKYTHRKSGVFGGLLTSKEQQTSDTSTAISVACGRPLSASNTTVQSLYVSDLTVLAFSKP
uniref:Uncharacterized protein n=1 Tax=Ditylenchus dipsaci TaxID=166011 RepID=A0A915CPS1_9BILA